MWQVENFFILSLIIQFAHSLEELATGFHKRWYLFQMPFWLFLMFEIVFTLFWLTVLVFQSFPYREGFELAFLVLMFANGVQHIVWWGISKKYVPGLITAFAHLLVLPIFYLSAGF